MIPARFESTRFPGKLLADLGGRPVLAHVIERAGRAGLDDLLVATDDPRLAAVAVQAGVTALQPPGEFQSGTDRIAAAIALLESRSGRLFHPDDVIVNIQGDEPFIEPELIRRVAACLADGSGSEARVRMATAATPAAGEDEANPNAVKVVLGNDGCALYFSRAPIPHFAADAETVPRLRHLGIYAYRRSFLATFVSWSPGRLERAEKLEQLRALERGVGIRVLEVSTRSVGIDTPEDLERARARLVLETDDPAPRPGAHLSERS